MNHLLQPLVVAAEVPCMHTEVEGWSAARQRVQEAEGEARGATWAVPAWHGRAAAAAIRTLVQPL